uniref:Uncharacterized protein n=1 Tax=Rhizophora mucronata TaxID=61149 RepID=A0A2P2IN85_RHIMU
MLNWKHTEFSCLVLQRLKY